MAHPSIRYDQPSMEMNEAVAHALDGSAVLFIGAGFSRGAVNIRGTGFRTGAELSSYFAKEAGLPDGIALDDAVEEFAARFGADRLIKELQEEFTARDIIPAQLEIAKARWKRVYTTNYDNVFETACAAVGRRCVSVTLSQAIRDIPKDAMLCIHLNGYVGSITRETIWSEVKLTDTSYLTASIADSSWATLFRQDLEIAQSVFFLGYSLWDLDLRRLLFEQETLRSKCFFVVGSTPEPATALRAARFGTVLYIDVQAFGTEVATISEKHVKAARHIPVPYCVQEYKAKAPRTPLADRYVFDLLSFGQVRPDYVWDSMHGGLPYSLVRRAADRALEAIKAGKKVVAFHADLGNGKTLVLETLKCKASEAGFRVFTLVHRGDTLFSELEFAAEGDAPSVFIVDNYPDWLTALKFFRTHMRDGISLAAAARTSAHDILIDRLAEVVQAGDIVEIAVDNLERDDVEWIVDYFNEYGFWGASAAWSRDRKSEYINRVCGGAWHGVLLKIFDAPQIVARLQAIFDDVKHQRNYYEVTVAVLILTVLSCPVSLNGLVDLCGQKVLEVGFRRDPAVREIVDFSSGEVRLRSAVAAEYVLKQVVDVNLFVRALIALAKAADRAAAASPEHFNVFRSLMRFSSLQYVLPETEKAKAVLAFYESIKTLGGCRANPLFWLQYGIACLVIEEFERAEKYFDSAYAFAKEREGFETYQIDNHYARFLLAKASRSTDVAAAMSAFRKARTIIFQQIVDDRRHYPYRVATGLAELYNAFAATLGKSQKDEIARAAKYVRDRIEKLPGFRQEQRYVADCWIAMSRIMEEAGMVTSSQG